MFHNEVVTKRCPICNLEEKNCKMMHDAGIDVHSKDNAWLIQRKILYTYCPSACKQNDAQQIESIGRY